MPYYHAIFKNTDPPQHKYDASFWTDGGEYDAPFSEESIRNRRKFPESAKFLAVNFFDNEQQLVEFHESYQWKSLVN